METHLKDIIEPIIVAIILFFGWLMKRSLYGEMETIKKEIDNIKEHCVMEPACESKRKGCSDLLTEKVDHLADMLKIITERQTLLISRFDSHMNGERK